MADADNSPAPAVVDARAPDPSTPSTSDGAPPVTSTAQPALVSSNRTFFNIVVEAVGLNVGEADDDSGLLGNASVDSGDQVPQYDPDDPYILPDAEDLETPARPNFVDVFMPPVDMSRVGHLAFAYPYPPAADPAKMIRGFFRKYAGDPRVTLVTGPQGAKLVCFDDKMRRDNTVGHSPYFGSYNTYLALDKIEGTDNHFQFEHEAFAKLAKDDYPMEHWSREHIAISTVPFANIHFIDPICLTSYDFSNVFITVKAEDLVDILGEMLLALLKYPFYPLFILDNGMNLISKSLTVLTPA